MEETKTTFLEESPGKQSSTRLNVLLVLVNGLLIADAIAFAGIYKYMYCDNHETLTAICTAVCVIIASTVIPAATWKVMQKDKEGK